MDWELRQSEATLTDPYGLESFLLGMDQEFRPRSASPLGGFTFLQDARQMLLFSRQIEKELLNAGGPGNLYVGFQNDQKLTVESKRYRRLMQAGITVCAFGEGIPSARDAEGLEGWYRLSPNHTMIENQWFLVTQVPQPIAFVGWEVSDESIWGLHGVTHPGKTFAGFVSEDPHVVGALVGHFEEVRASAKRETPGQSGDARTVINNLTPRRVMLLADDGKRPFLQRAVSALAGSAPIPGNEFFLYDLAAASYLLDPYPKESDEKQRHQPLTTQFVRDTVKRPYLADLMAKFEKAGSKVKGVLPTGVGFGDLAKWCGEIQVDVVVAPVEFAEPSLPDRLRGYRIENLASKVSCSVVVDDPNRGAWIYKEASKA
ncbi:MAG: hypothetical protein GTO40_30265 [Deltaproteobacteria bacterium]|nr:hypothetical protein [Deltaproteobacteria bacterium]